MSWIPSYKKKTDPSYVPCDWSTGTDAEIIEALEKHYAGEVDLTEYWSIGDTRTVTLGVMYATGVGESHEAQDVVFVLSNVGGKYLADGITECVFQVDQLNCLNEIGYMNSTRDNTGGWKNSARRTWCNEVYKNAIPSTLRSIFKEFINQSGRGTGNISGVYDTTDTFALRAEIEVFGSTTYSISGEGSQVTWYETASNRFKQLNGNNYSWWERSAKSGDGEYFCYVTNNGTRSSQFASANMGIAPFGVI